MVAYLTDFRRNATELDVGLIEVGVSFFLHEVSIRKHHKKCNPPIFRMPLEIHATISVINKRNFRLWIPIYTARQWDKSIANLSTKKMSELQRWLNRGDILLVSKLELSLLFRRSLKLWNLSKFSRELKVKGFIAKDSSGKLSFQSFQNEKTPNKFIFFSFLDVKRCKLFLSRHRVFEHFLI